MQIYWIVRSLTRHSQELGIVKQAIERTARLGAVLKGLGYRCIHLGGIHDSFETGGDLHYLFRHAGHDSGN